MAAPHIYSVEANRRSPVDAVLLFSVGIKCQKGSAADLRGSFQASIISSMSASEQLLILQLLTAASERAAPRGDAAAGAKEAMA